ncbi:MAG: HAD family phosphatase, partial [Erysipelotrichaceae bacterium]|nr:HAD family phosphatase [Erysipelotrichaceae bacterium]
MDLKLVLCDIDGTLTHSDRTMGQHNIDAINALLNHGVMFGVASGRKAMELREFVERWHLVRRPQVIIGMNGSEIWHEDSQKLYDYYQLS